MILAVLITLASVAFIYAYVVAAGYTYGRLLRVHARNGCKKCSSDEYVTYHRSAFPDPDNGVPQVIATVWPLVFPGAVLWFTLIRPAGRLGIAAHNAGRRLGQL